MGKDGKGWKSKGKPPLRSEGERQHARAVNAARAAEGLPNKSTGSVSRSKARALAHREKSQAVPADSIGEPAVLPLAPPKAPPRERIVLTAAQKGEVLPKPPETDRSRSPAAASLGGTGSPQVRCSPQTKKSSNQTRLLSRLGPHSLPALVGRLPGRDV